MHESMTIADVGDIVNVSGSRIATPFAPPNPGSTPISTPSVMPTSISPTFNGCQYDREAVQRIQCIHSGLAPIATVCRPELEGDGCSR